MRRTIDELARTHGSGTLNNGTAFLRWFGHDLVSWLWLDQAVAASVMDVSGLEREVFAAVAPIKIS